MRPSRRGDRWHWASSWSWTLSCRETRRWSLAEELAALSSRWAMLCFLRLEMNFCTSFLFLVNPISSPIQGKEQGTVVSINSETPCKTKTKITGKWFAKIKTFRIYLHVYKCVILLGEILIHFHKCWLSNVCHNVSNCWRKLHFTVWIISFSTSAEVKT